MDRILRAHIITAMRPLCTYRVTENNDLCLSVKRIKRQFFFSDTSGRKPILSMHTSLNFIGREDLVDPFG